VKTSLNDQQRKNFEEHHELDFSIELKNVARFRVNAFRQARGEAVVFRVIPSKILSLEELGLPKVLREVCKTERGLILVTGPTGSGKSTTLASMIDVINNTLKGHIITIEDPIEFVHESKNCLVNQRELGAHTLAFANALRSALREDPDIILVGEMRDLETISLALTAAETGPAIWSSPPCTPAEPRRPWTESLTSSPRSSRSRSGPSSPNPSRPSSPRSC
jgi:twitching motility protein PilT